MACITCPCGLVNTTNLREARPHHMCILAALDDVDEDYDDEFEDEDEDALLDDDLDLEDDLDDEDELLDDEDDVTDVSEGLSSVAEDLPFEIENVSYEEAVAQTAPEQAASRPVIRVYSQEELDEKKAQEDAAAAAALAIPGRCCQTLFKLHRTYAGNGCTVFAMTYDASVHVDEHIRHHGSTSWLC